MIVSSRVSFVVLLVSLSVAWEVFPVGVGNNYAFFDPNVFTISTPSPADEVVAQALVEEGHNGKDFIYNDEQENARSQKVTFKPTDKAPKKGITKDQNHSESKIKTKSGADKDHDKIEHIKKQYKGKKGHKAAKFGEKKGHKKGHKTKGYNNRFHKDEYHKEHKLYGDAYRDKNKNTYRNTHENHGQKAQEYNKSNKKTDGYNDNRFGKKGVDDVGKFDDHHEDFNKKSGHKNKNIHHTHHVKIKDEQNPYPNHRPF